MEQRYPIKNASPAKRRNKLEQLNISDKELEGSLDLTSFTNLKKLYCNDNKLTSLKLNNLVKLETIICSNNQLVNLEISGSNNLEYLDGKINHLNDLNSLLSNLNPPKLKQLYLRDNNFLSSDLTPLCKFTNLEHLELSNNYQTSNNNDFYKSLKPLQGLSKLESLYIIDSTSDRNVYYSSNKKDGPVRGQIKQLISSLKEDWKNIHSDFTSEMQKDIIAMGKIKEGQEVNVNSLDIPEKDKVFLGTFQKIQRDEEDKKIDQERVLNNMESSENIEYSNENYSKNTRINIKDLSIIEKGLEGELDLSDFINLERLFCSKNKLTELEIANCPKLKMIFCYDNNLASLDLSKNTNLTSIYCDNNKLVNLDVNNQITDLDTQNCPLLKKEKIIWTNNISSKGLQGSLKLEDFPNLEKIKCDGNKITHLEIINCPSLKEIDCGNNQLTELNIKNYPDLKVLHCGSNLLRNLDLSKNKNLEELSIMNNNFVKQDLSFLSHLINLKKLYLGNTNIDYLLKERVEQGVYNNFIGSLEPLKNLNKLEKLDIKNTDIDSGLEYLPDNVKEFSCSADGREGAKVGKIYEELIIYGLSLKALKEAYYPELEIIRKTQSGNRLTIVPSIPDELIKVRKSKNKEIYDLEATNYFEVSLRDKRPFS
nr:2898_t:CDS:2 [Entrophospora candida]